MTDWTDHLARGRRWAEAAFWLLAATAVALSLAAGTALALWLDMGIGTRTGKETTILIDLNALPEVQALAVLPPEAVATPTPTPDPPPEPEPTPEPPPPPIKAALPDPLLLPTLPELKPQPERKPVLKPVRRPEAKPKPKAEDRPKEDRPKEDRPKPKAEPHSKPDRQKPTTETRMQVDATGAKAPKGAASANARAKWHAKVQTQFARQLQKKSFRAKGATLTLLVSVAADGSYTASISRSSGNAELDAAVMGQLKRMRRLAPPPDGVAQTLILPVELR